MHGIITATAVYRSPFSHRHDRASDQCPHPLRRSRCRGIFEVVILERPRTYIVPSPRSSAKEVNNEMGGTALNDDIKEDLWFLSLFCIHKNN